MSTFHRDEHDPREIFDERADQTCLEWLPSICGSQEAALNASSTDTGTPARQADTDCDLVIATKVELCLLLCYWAQSNVLPNLGAALS